MAESNDAVAFEAHAGYSLVTVAVQELEHDVELKEGDTYVTSDPAVIQALDQAEFVKRVAKAPTKAAARAKAEEKS